MDNLHNLAVFTLIDMVKVKKAGWQCECGKAFSSRRCLGLHQRLSKVHGSYWKI